MVSTHLPYRNGSSRGHLAQPRGAVNLVQHISREFPHVGDREFDLVAHARETILAQEEAVKHAHAIAAAEQLWHEYTAD
jgi:hypothetical protein